AIGAVSLAVQIAVFAAFPSPTLTLPYPVTALWTAGATAAAVASARGYDETVPAGLANAFIKDHVVGLRRGADRILGVEHLLAACYGLGVACLAVDAPQEEVPFGDGSALPFVRLLCRAGLFPAPGPIPPRTQTGQLDRRLRPLIVTEPGAFICALPNDPNGCPTRSLTLGYYVDFAAPEGGEQYFRTRIQRRSFIADLAPARTFGRWPDGRAVPRWLGQTRTGARGLLLPAHPRLADEQARHKALDFLGDLALLNRRVSARVLAYRAGHRLHHELLRRMEREWR
ncbi:MAG: UDP-3-O-acyl-N-acetylglucosamine deacetylase, partial [candidate division WOR-3 bacterium]